MAEMSLQVKIRPTVDAADAVVCAKMLEIWLNEHSERRIDITFNEDGRSEIHLVSEQNVEQHEPTVHKPVDLNDSDSFPW